MPIFKQLNTPNHTKKCECVWKLPSAVRRLRRTWRNSPRSLVTSMESSIFRSTENCGAVGELVFITINALFLQLLKVDGDSCDCPCTCESLIATCDGVVNIVDKKRLLGGIFAAIKTMKKGFLYRILCSFSIFCSLLSTKNYHIPPRYKFYEPNYVL